MTSSSFHTVNCWTYLGRQDMTYWPYWCRASALSWYLSAGLTMGARRAPSAADSQSIAIGPSLELSAEATHTRTLSLAHVRRLGDRLLQQRGRRERTAHPGRPRGRSQRAAGAQPHQGTSRGHCGWQLRVRGNGEVEGRQRRCSSSTPRELFLEDGRETSRAR